MDFLKLRFATFDLFFSYDSIGSRFLFEGSTWELGRSNLGFSR